MFLPSEVCANKLVLYSKLIIFIGYKNNSYCFMYYIQENIIFCSIYTIFDKKLYPKCTDSYIRVLQSQELRVVQVKEPCIKFIQENSIESSLQSCLSYIPNLMVCAYYCIAYPK